jgi:Uma2 family endonuclease
MATATLPGAKKEVGERRFVLYGIDWDGYETFLKLLPRTRMTYDRGVLELMSPLSIHEVYKRRLGRLIEIVGDVLKIPYIAAGSTTFKRRLVERGLEPDESFYLGSIGRLTNRMEFDLEVDPPPDLAVEVDITSSSLDRLSIYAALGVPEVWRFDSEVLMVHVLRPGQGYETCASSAAFPYLPLDDVVNQLFLTTYPDDLTWSRVCRVWVRRVVAPRYREFRR